MFHSKSEKQFVNRITYYFIDILLFFLDLCDLELNYTKINE